MNRHLSPVKFCALTAALLCSLAVCAVLPEVKKMEEKRVTVRDIDMFYRTAGEGPPVVYVHGNTGSSLWYDRVMDLPGFTTYAPDLPNFGQSGHIAASDIDLYADYLRDWMKKLSLGKPVVVGHSLGGAVAVSLTIRYPDLVHKLVLADSAPLSGFPTPPERYALIEQFRSDRELMKKALKPIVPTLDDEEFLDKLTDDAMKMNPSSYVGNARALNDFDYTGRGGEYAGEVLVIAGEKDILISEETARSTAEAFPKGTLRVLPGVGHSVMAEDPDLFKNVVLDFIGR